MLYFREAHMSFVSTYWKIYFAYGHWHIVLPDLFRNSNNDSNVASKSMLNTICTLLLSTRLSRM